jgi:hypothetical protein
MIDEHPEMFLSPSMAMSMADDLADAVMADPLEFEDPSRIKGPAGRMMMRSRLPSTLAIIDSSREQLLQRSATEASGIGDGAAGQQVGKYDDLAGSPAELGRAATELVVSTSPHLHAAKQGQHGPADLRSAETALVLGGRDEEDEELEAAPLDSSDDVSVHDEEEDDNLPDGYAPAGRGAGMFITSWLYLVYFTVHQ